MRTSRIYQRSRATLHWAPLLLVIALLLSACPAPAAPAPEAPAAAATEAPAAEAPAAAATEAPAEEVADPMVTIYGETLPDDAVPYAEQVSNSACSTTANQITFDFQVSVYQRYCLSDNFSDPLTELDKDFNVVPAAAESWEVSEDGLTWSFHLRPGQVWSDGTPLTAHDYVATFQYLAEPEHAWDFAWFYNGVIQNWEEVIAGELPKEELGVAAADDLTFQITTQKPFPPMPGMMKFGWTLQKKALEEHGPLYNSDPATHVSSGPFILETFEPGKTITVVANPTYKGYRPPRLYRLVAIYMDPGTEFAAFQNGDIDSVGYESLSPADLELVLQDPVLSENYLRHFGDFRTDYLLFDTFNPPFDNLDVRKAFAHAIDREAIVKNVYGEVKAMAAYGMLMPGFPSSSTKGELNQYQEFNCELAKEHLATAGYADGAGFPSLELWLRNESPALQAVFQAVAASITQCLNIPLEVSNKDYKVYMDALNAKPTQLTFGAISYGMDYLDPANMLDGLWVTGSRHSWSNPEFDRLVKEATPLTSDPALRDQLFRDAEKILVEDVGGIFLFHRWQGTLYQPYIQGDSIREPDSIGIIGPHWGNDSAGSNIYIAQH
ncbi:MAG: peptide ABC transporter substrate-binding protein [Caldilineaceae bacterium]|nr:peptide ABC transporter substrate-binding protein [Caldilineaceae bacterium]